MADTITLHYANVDTETTPYAEILKTTVVGYTGYGSVNIRVYDPGKQFQMEGEETKYANGEIRGSLDMRAEFELNVIPFSYKASSWDVGDLEAIIVALRKKHKWLELNNYSTQFNRNSAYHDASKVIPVELRSIDQGVSRKDGTQSITLKFAKVWEE